jgi:hypothetical protein
MLSVTSSELYKNLDVYQLKIPFNLKSFLLQSFYFLCDFF